MRKIRTRAFSILLTCAMLLSLLPVTALAVDEVAEVGETKCTSLADAVENATTGQTIKMLANTDISETGLTIPSGKSLTLDLNGKQIKANNTSNGRIAVYGELTIQDSTDTYLNGTGNGKIYTDTDYSSSASTCMIASIGENALVTLESGYIYAVRPEDTANKGQFGLGVIDGGDLTITGGKVEAGWYAVSGNGNNNTQNSVINIKGGELISTADYAVYLPQSGTTNISGGTIYGAAGGVSIQRSTLNISGDALITSKGTGNTGNWGDGTGGQDCAALNVNARYGDCTISISGSTLTAEGTAVVIATGTNYAADISITGGSFSSDVKDYIAPNYECVGPDGNNRYTVQKLENKLVVDGSVGTDGNVTGSLEGTVGTNGAAVGDSTDSGITGDNTASASKDVSISLTTGTEGAAGSAATTTLEVTRETAQSLNKADSLTIKTDAGDVSFDSAALNTIAAGANDDVTIQVTKSESAPQNTLASYTVTAESDSKNLLPYGSANGTVTITVKLPDGKSVDQIQAWYVIESAGSLSYVEKLQPKASAANGYVDIPIGHLSTVVLLNANQPVTGAEATWYESGTLKSGTLDVALQALDTVGGTITLIKNAALTSAQYTISKPITIQGAFEVTATVPAEVNGAAKDSYVGFTITENGSLTLDGVKMTVQGTEHSDKYYGTGVDVQYGGTLTVQNGAELNLKNLNRGTISSKPSTSTAAPGQFSITNAKMTATAIGGNFSNGGKWTIDKSTLSIDGCGDYGLSANDIWVKNGSSLTVNNVDKAGIIITNEANSAGGELKVETNSHVTVSNSGKELPFGSKWSKAESVIDLGHASGGSSYADADAIPNVNARLSVLTGSSITLSNNKGTGGQLLDYIYLTNTAALERDSSSTVPTVVMEAPDAESDQCTVEFRADGVLYQAKHPTVTDGKTSSFGIPNDAPVKSNYKFVGWAAPSGVTTESASDGGTILNGATAGSTYIFTALYEKESSSSGGSSGSSSTTYQVTVDKAEGGKITVSPTRAEKGDTVTITVKPDEGYELGKLTVTDKDGDKITLTQKDDNKYTFKMPAGKVTVKATFTEIVVEPEQPELPFSDVAEQDWFYDAVVYVYENELMNGTSATTFSPSVTTSRAMMLTMLARYDGVDTSTGSTWYEAGAAWAVAEGVSDGTNLEADLTREQLVTMLWRYAGSPMVEKDLPDYPDRDEVSDWAVRAMVWAVDNGIITGNGAGELNPQGSASRAEVATILMRFIQL